MTTFLTADIWQATRARSRQGKVTAVVAYVTEDHLKLRKGDVLVCDASDQTIASGGTSARILEELRKSKVRLFHLPKLHAKVVRLSTGVLVGSANMTINSGGLREAAIFSLDASLLREVDRFIDGILASKRLVPLTAGEMKRLLAIPVTTRVPYLDVHAKIHSERDKGLWISRVDPLGGRESARIDAELGARLNDGSPYGGQWIVYGPEDASASRIQLADELVLVDRDLKVSGPHSVTGVHSLVKKWRGKKVRQIVVTYDEVRGARSIWENVDKKLREGGLRRRSGRPRLLRVTGEVRSSIFALLRKRARPAT